MAAIENSYLQAKEALSFINSLIGSLQKGPLSTREISSAQETLRGLFEDPFFRVFYDNVFYQKIGVDEKQLLAKTGEISIPRLEAVRQALFAFIYNTASHRSLEETALSIPPHLEELMKEAVEESATIDETASKLQTIPSLKEQIENAQRIRSQRIAGQKESYEKAVSNLQGQIRQQAAGKEEEFADPAIASVKKTAIQEASAKAMELTSKHLEAGGNLEDPFLAQAITQQIVNSDVSAAAWLDKGQLTKTVGEFLGSQNANEISAGYTARKLTAPTPTNVVQIIKDKVSIDERVAAELFTEFEKVIAIEPQLGTHEAFAKAIFAKFPKSNPQEVLEINQTLFSHLNNYRQGIIRLFPNEKISKNVAWQVSQFCRAVNSLDPKEIVSFFTALEFSHGITSDALAPIVEQLPQYPQLADKLKSLKRLPKILESPPKKWGIISKIPPLHYLGEMGPEEFLAREKPVTEKFGNFLDRIPIARKAADFFEQFAPSTVKTHLAASLLKFAAKNAGSKGLKGLLAKGATWLGTKIGGKAAAAIIGGPIGTAIAVAAAAWDILKLLNSPEVKKLLKKVATAAAGLLMFGLGLIGGLLSALGGAILSGLGIISIAGGIIFPPLAPILIPTGIGLTLAGAGKFLKPLLAKAGSAVQGALHSIGNSLSNLIGGGTAGIPTYLSLSPLIAVGTTSGLTLISYMTLISAFAIPPSGQEIGAPIIAGNRVSNPNYDHPAIKIANTIGQYSNGVLSQNSWNTNTERELQEVAPEGFEELRHSVWEIAGNNNLQCVGFKIAAEKELGINLPRQNASAFLYNHPGCNVVPSNGAREGDNAVWGANEKCPIFDSKEADKLCSSNINCCGHIGVVTGTKGNVKILITSAHGESGAVYTEETSRTNPTMFLRCER